MPDDDDKRTAIDLLLDLLEENGVEYIFGVPGSAITPLYQSLEGRKIKHILAKHEEGAAFMAAGYAKASGRLGVTCATTGPGGTNALTGIACAYSDCTPVLLITGQVATRSFGRGALQESTQFGVDIVEMFRPCTKLSTLVPSGERMDHLARLAIRTAMSGRPGPVHLNIPIDVQKEKVEPPMPPSSRRFARTVDRTAAADAAKLLATAKRPAIFAGHGVTVARAWDELFELATRRKIPVATTPKAKGVFPENHPLSLGVFGFGGHPRAEAYLTADYVDVLLVVGSSMNEIATNSWDPNLKPQVALIQVDIEPQEMGKNYSADVTVLGDARAVLHEINEQLSQLAPPPPEDADPLANVRTEVPRYVGTEYQAAAEKPFKPQRLVEEMREVLPDDALLFVDNGNSILWGGHFFEARRPNTYFLSMGMASMGIAGPAALGAKLGAPKRKVVALLGDGAFAMNGIEVHTAADHRIPMVWVVLNNNSLGMVYHGERMILGHDLGACRYNVPIDISGMAKAMGATAFMADSPRNFRDALECALETRGPSVIEAKIDAEEVPYLLARRARTIAKSFDNMPPSLRVPVWPRK